MPATAEREEAWLWAFARRRAARPPALSELDPTCWPEPALAATSIVWSRRVVNETHSVALAAELLRAFARTSLLTASIEAALERLAADERCHVELAAAFLDRIGAPVPDVEPGLPTAEDDLPSLFLLRCVATGLAVCETVSAVRFAAVRAHADLAIPRACIEVFLRDEIAHARLGLALLPSVLSHHVSVVGADTGAADLHAELRATFRHLDVVIGLDAERRGLQLQARPQPSCNAGVIEPALDALAFREAITGTVVPRLSRLGIDAGPIWTRRWRDA